MLIRIKLGKTWKVRLFDQCVSWINFKLNIKDIKYGIFSKNEKISPLSVGIVMKVNVIIFFKAW